MAGDIFILGESLKVKDSKDKNFQANTDINIDIFNVATTELNTISINNATSCRGNMILEDPFNWS